MSVRNWLGVLILTVLALGYLALAIRLSNGGVRHFLPCVAGAAGLAAALALYWLASWLVSS